MEAHKQTRQQILITIQCECTSKQYVKTCEVSLLVYGLHTCDKSYQKIIQWVIKMRLKIPVKINP